MSEPSLEVDDPSNDNGNENENDPAYQASSTSEKSMFVEHETAFQRIDILTESNGGSWPTPEKMDSALTALREILDKYLELPSLLDKYIESMVVKLTTGARNLMDDPSNVASSAQQFWSSPLPRQFSALYALSKVRGRKRIQKFLPHQVEDVHVILSTLQGVHTLSRNENMASLDSASIGQPQLWESMFVLWNWMGMLSKVPFESSVVIDMKSIDDLVELAKEYLSEAGPTRDMASACLASWLSRPDLEKTHLEAFQVWSNKVLEEFLQDSKEVIRTMGVLQTLVTIIKVSSSDRDIMLRFIAPLRSTVMRIAETNPNNQLLRKYLVKWWTRTGVLYMPPRLAEWRYRRGRRSLKENLLRMRTNAPSTNGETAEVEVPKNRSPEEYELFLVPDQVEDALGEVITGLTDTSTVVRWSAAKGIGRVTERLPAICSDDVLDAILGLCQDRERDNDWHGACLAMAELARRGLLLPHRLDEVIPKIVEAIHFDVPRRQTSVGAHVRDAACYTYWAIARAYSPEVLREFVSELSPALVTAFLFDREVNCRRAASAAFQEFVGRQGATNFKNGIDILTKADFFSLGNRMDAYLVIAPDIARYDDYRGGIIDHIYKVKLQHWDLNIRLLSSQALGKLTPLDIERVGGEVMQYLLRNSLDERNVQLRHGSVLGLAEVVLAIGNMKDANDGSFHGFLSAETLSSIAELVPIIEKKRLYRGKGGEQMRAAVCRLIECISKAGVPLAIQQQVRLLDSIDACIPHPNEEVQEQATLALCQLMRVYFPVGPQGPSERLQKRVVDKYVQQVKTNINPAATRGFSMALGRLPAKLLAPSSKVLDFSLACLCRISRPDATIGNDKDAETRRNALVALARICETVGLVPKGDEQVCPVGLTSTQVGHVFSALFRGVGDYNMERRGDVGSMSRVAAMHGLVSLVLTVNRHPPGTVDVHFDREICTQLVGGLLKQLGEKLDMVRNEAGKCLVQILTHIEPEIPYIVEKKRLVVSLGISDRTASINWADAAVTFPLLVEVLGIEEYFEYVVAGLVISAGSLTQSVVKEAGSALVRWVKGASDSNVDRLGAVLLELFHKHQHDGRVILPLLKTISLLMNRLSIDRLIHDASFSSSLLAYLKEEESTCKDVHRLSAIIDVSLGLVGSENDRRKQIMAFLCRLLMHPFPRVRRITAENFYVKLGELEDYGESHPAIDLLLTSPWDGTESDVKKMATDVASSLDVLQLVDQTQA